MKSRSLTRYLASFAIPLALAGGRIAYGSESGSLVTPETRSSINKVIEMENEKVREVITSVRRYFNESISDGEFGESEQIMAFKYIRLAKKNKRAYNAVAEPNDLVLYNLIEGAYEGNRKGLEDYFSENNLNVDVESTDLKVILVLAFLLGLNVTAGHLIGKWRGR